MEYREMKKDLRTSLLGFGCMRFPTDKNGIIVEDEAVAMVEEAYQSGVNYFDTAYPYHDGQSESFVGRTMKKYPRESFFLATKLPCWEVHSVDDAKRIFQKQLDNLQTDYIDFYLLHALGAERFQNMVDLGVVDYLAEEQKKGRIRQYGFSFHDGYEAFEKIITYRKWDFCQIQYNYMDNHTQAGEEGYALAEKLGVPLVIMEPIKGGLLSKLPDEIASILTPFDEKRQPAAWALGWVATHSNVKVILSGMSTLTQVQQNVKTFSGFKPYSEEEMQAIDHVAEALRKRVMNGCTGCRYCMPCPAGVDIPRNFAIWNTYHIYNSKGQLDWEWNHDLPNEAKADQCIKCGKCEKVCPQKLSIRDNLAALNEEIKGVFGR